MTSESMVEYLIRTYKVKCPNCNAKFNEDIEICEKCGFDMDYDIRQKINKIMEGFPEDLWFIRGG